MPQLTKVRNLSHPFGLTLPAMTERALLNPDEPTLARIILFCTLKKRLDTSRNSGSGLASAILGTYQYSSKFTLYVGNVDKDCQHAKGLKVYSMITF